MLTEHSAVRVTHILPDFFVNYTTTSKSNIGNCPIFLKLDRCQDFIFNLDSLGLGVPI